MASFHGDLEDLEAALGMLRLGQHLGWKVLVLIHNKRTIREYEEIWRSRSVKGLSRRRSELQPLCWLHGGKFCKVVSGTCQSTGAARFRRGQGVELRALIPPLRAAHALVHNLSCDLPAVSLSSGSYSSVDS